MSGKSYNGFSPEQRSAASAWARIEERKGNRVKPDKCAACGQTGGRIGRHSEDYSTPHGAHIGAFTFCFRCHMAVHCRNGNPGAWKTYLRQTREGAMHPAPITWEEFRAWWYALRQPVSPPMVNRPRVRTILDDIADGLTMPSPNSELPERATA